MGAGQRIRPLQILDRETGGMVGRGDFLETFGHVQKESNKESVLSSATGISGGAAVNPQVGTPALRWHLAPLPTF